MNNNAAGDNNTATGGLALGINLIGNNNTAYGYQALSYNTGNNNVALGYSAGNAVTTGSYNIDIGNIGAGESNTIRIGTAGGYHRANGHLHRRYHWGGYWRWPSCAY